MVLERSIVQLHAKVAHKAAYACSVGLLASQIHEPMAAGMTLPLDPALATYLFKNRFTADEQEAGSAAAVRTKSGRRYNRHHRRNLGHDGHIISAAETACF